MASIDRGKLISKLGYVAYFNDKVWGQIFNTANGKIYHAGDNNVSLNQDKITNVVEEGTEGKYVENGTSTISIKKAPHFSSTAYTGSNTTTGNVWADLNRPAALRLEHLKTINGSAKQYFTLYASDVDNAARTYWTTKGQERGLSGDALTAFVNENLNIIVADALYKCCFDIIRKLISIRPFTASWQHDSSVANKKINEKLNNGGYSYGIFIDNPSVPTSWTNNSGSGTWGAGGRLSRWQITLGGSISALKLNEASVTRNGVYAGSVAAASNAVTMVSNFWTAWSDRCKAKNTFDYKLFSCHLNCHSSCHSSCHGSRSRR